MVNQRLQALQRTLQQTDLDALLITDESNVRYLSGYTNHEAYLLIPAQGEGLLLTDSRYEEQARAECPAYTVVLVQAARGGLFQELADQCQRLQILQLGFEPSISYQFYLSIASRADFLTLYPVAGAVEQQRIIKDQLEQAQMRTAAAATDRVFAALCETIHAGQSELDVEWQLLSLIRAEGCDSSFQPVVVSGSRGSLPHGMASDKLLERGDLLTLDFGCCYQGYRADMTRTVAIGTASQLQKERYQLVLEANLRGIAEVRQGIPGAEIDRIVRSFLAEQGYAEYFAHSLGHGIGLDVHEQPNLSPSSQIVLQQGNFVTVEPGIYLPNWGGIRIEDMVLVTEHGCEVMFRASKELLVLD